MAKKEPSKFQRKLDAFSRTVFWTEDGKPRSSFLLYAFCLSLLFAIIYVFAYLLLLEPLELLFKGAGLRVQQIAEYLLPAVIGSVPCVAVFFLTKKHRGMVPVAYLWLAFFLAAASIAMAVIVEDRIEYGLYWLIVGIPFALSVIVGGAAAWWLYLRRLKRFAAEHPEQYEAMKRG